MISFNLSFILHVDLSGMLLYFLQVLHISLLSVVLQIGYTSKGTWSSDILRKAPGERGNEVPASELVAHTHVRPSRF